MYGVHRLARYIYIYMCVCVCVCVSAHSACIQTRTHVVRAHAAAVIII